MIRIGHYPTQVGYIRAARGYVQLNRYEEWGVDSCFRAGHETDESHREIYRISNIGLMDSAWAILSAACLATA